jgi:hypothetical protein
VQFLEVIRSAHLVLGEEGKNIRVVSFDMHLLDIARGCCCTVTGGVGRGEEKREGRELGKSGDGAGRGLTVTRRG